MSSSSSASLISSSTGTSLSSMFGRRAATHVDKQAPWSTQQIPIQYSKGQNLKRFLDEEFGPGNYRVEIKLGHYHISAPRRVTQEDIARINTQGHYQRQY